MKNIRKCAYIQLLAASITEPYDTIDNERNH